MTTSTSPSSPRRFQRLFAYVVAVSLLATFNVVQAEQAAQAEPIGGTECFPTVLMLRGSGQPSLGETTYAKTGTNDPLIKTNGHEGETLSRVIQNFVDQADPAKTISKLRFVGIDYDAALPISPMLP